MDHIDQLKQALEISPENISLRKIIINQYLKCLQFETAEEAIKEAISYDKEDLELRYLLAQSVYRQNKLNEAILHLEYIFNHSNEHAKALLLYARIVESQGDQLAAHEYYTQALKHDNSLEDKEFEKTIISAIESDSLSDQYKNNITGYDYENDEDETEFFDSYQGDPLPSLSEKLTMPHTRTFREIGGMQYVKNSIQQYIINPIENQKLFEHYGQNIGHNILLYGPPGCGKTIIAQAIAAETSATFLNIKLNNIFNINHGESESNLHEIFQTARQDLPCILLFDEIDALTMQRGEMSGHDRQIISQFFLEIDEIKNHSQKIFIIGTSNAPWHMDGAFQRSGRFDSVVFVAPPGYEDRKHIFEILLKKIPYDTIDTNLLAQKTKGYSGADIHRLINIAVEKKLYTIIHGKPQTPLNTADIESVIGNVTPSHHTWFNEIKDKKTLINQSGIYDELFRYIEGKKGE